MRRSRDGEDDEDYDNDKDDNDEDDLGEYEEEVARKAKLALHFDESAPRQGELPDPLGH